MPSNCVHRYDEKLGPIDRGVVVIGPAGGLILPTTGVATVKLMKDVYNRAGQYCLFRFIGQTLGVVGSLDNLTVDSSDLATANPPLVAQNLRIASDETGFNNGDVLIDIVRK